MAMWLKLVLRNAFRHRLRASLTIAGFAAAVLALGILQTIVAAWYLNVDVAVPSRLIVRNAISFTMPLPLGYEKRIAAVEGVRGVTHVTWFGGVYKNPRNFFPQFAIDQERHFALHPELVISDRVRNTFLQDRRAAIAGRQLADRYGFKAGDVIHLEGTLFPGSWEFVIAGVVEGRDPETNTSQLFIRWDYLNEILQSRLPEQSQKVGFFVVDVTDKNRVSEVSQAIDRLFRNSPAETLTETERAFQLAYVKQTEAILLSVRMVSFVVVLIILAVMANTISMATRERMSEYAMLKALGFGPSFVMRLVAGEALLISVIGGAIGIAMTSPVAARIGELSDAILPRLEVSDVTIIQQISATIAVGIVSSIVPVWKAARVRIVDGLRAVG